MATTDGITTRDLGTRYELRAGNKVATLSPRPGLGWIVTTETVTDAGELVPALVFRNGRSASRLFTTEERAVRSAVWWLARWV